MVEVHPVTSSPYPAFCFSTHHVSSELCFPITYEKETEEAIRFIVSLFKQEACSPLQYAMA